ncbi:MAG: hypothetical protein R3Y24_10535 [Eubacteriales bacterium]
MNVNYLKKLNSEKLQNIIVEMYDILTEKQKIELDKIIEQLALEDINSMDNFNVDMVERMSQEFVDEKMSQMKEWMHQIDESELYLYANGYEDYSSGYWDSDWIVEYEDEQGIGDIIMSIIRFAKDCVEDRKYQEANTLYKWLWEMAISTDEEYEDSVDLEKLIDEELIKIDREKLALFTLYTTYQVVEAKERVEMIYEYFIYYSFRTLHIEDFFSCGREKLIGEEQFWKDWISLLKNKTGDAESRLLREAILYYEGVDGIVREAEENCDTHPSLYLVAMEEYLRNHNYAGMENIGQKALVNIDVKRVIRSEIALKVAYASECLDNKENVMKCCWEAFCSNYTDANYLRLFATNEMALLYGLRGKEIWDLVKVEKVNEYEFTRNTELRQNNIDKIQYQTLCFYMGDFKATKAATKNPTESLGWSGKFVRKGVNLFLLYLYEETLPTKAAAAIARTLEFTCDSGNYYNLSFENKIIEESNKHKVSIFWNYFQRWKQYFPMEQKEKESYLKWVEKIVHSRANAIVGGKFRNHYASVAILLAMVAEIKVQMGENGAKNHIFAMYKKNYPRHSAFQAVMREYFGM